MTNKKVIIFDFDGVLVDSIGIMTNWMEGKYPGMTAKDVKDLHTGNIFEEVKKTKFKIINETDEEIKNRDVLYTKNKSQATLYKGVKEMLDVLAKHYNLVINTSSVVANCIPILETQGINNHFTLLATKELHPSKVEKFKIIAEKFQLNLKEILFITDTLGDVREADIAGVPTVVVTWGLHDRSYFDVEKHSNIIAIVDSVPDLEQEIKKFF